jgi:hypothetical protein
MSTKEIRPSKLLVYYEEEVQALGAAQGPKIHPKHNGGIASKITALFPRFGLHSDINNKAPNLLMFNKWMVY